jgi:hypothetical protein
MNSSAKKNVGDDQAVWNQAHDRLRDFLSAFALADHARVSRLTLKLLDQARELHRQDPSLDPVCLVMAQAQNQMEQWLASNLEQQNQPASRLLSSGYVALLLSRALRTAPETFLTAPLPESLRDAMRETLLVTGHDLKVSSMTPRHIDYGPMLDFARNTWHRWNSREILIAVLFWAGVYVIFYWWFSQVL